MDIQIPPNPNARYAAPDKSAIDCELVLNGDKRVPFSAHRDDIEPHGRAIFEALEANFTIGPYVAPEPEGKEG